MEKGAELRIFEDLEEVLDYLEADNPIQAARATIKVLEEDCPSEHSREIFDLKVSLDLLERKEKNSTEKA